MQKNKISAAAKRLLQRRGVAAVLAAYVLFLLFSVVWFAANGQARNALLSAAYLLIAPAFLLIERAFRLKFGAVFAALLFFLAAGGILGSSYDVYTALPCFDDILHGLSGVIFACAGFGLAQKVFAKDGAGKSFFACLAAGFVFTLAVASLWELFEYASYAFFGIDMQEDTLIHGFASYFLAGSHNATVVVDGIEKTVIYYGNGQTLVLDGYLDIGMYDTLNDITVCFLGGLAWVAVLLIDHALHGPFRRLLLPRLLQDTEQKSADVPAKPAQPPANGNDR